MTGNSVSLSSLITSGVVSRLASSNTDEFGGEIEIFLFLFKLRRDPPREVDGAGVEVICSNL